MAKQSLIKAVLNIFYWIMCVGLAGLILIQTALIFSGDPSIPINMQVVTLLLFTVLFIAFFLKVKTGKSGVFRGAIGAILIIISATPLWFDFAHYNLSNPDPMGSTIVAVVFALLGVALITWSYHAQYSSNK